MRLVSAAIAVLIGLAIAATSEAATATTPGWIDQASLRAVIEEHGVMIGGSRQPIDFASCQGLRRYGAREVGGFVQYHRLKCLLGGADNRSYWATIAVTRSEVSASVLANRGEPPSLVENLRFAEETLRVKARSVAFAPGTKLTAAQKAGTAKFLQPYRDRVAAAQEALEPYRTRFWWRVTSVR